MKKIQGSIQLDKLLGLKQVTLVLQVLFLVILSVWLIISGFFPTIEIMLLMATLLLLWRARERQLLVALIPFFLLLISYEILRGFADNFTPADIHVTDLIAYEKRLFGGVIPAAYIQSSITNPSVTRFLDPIMNIIYMSHFVNPLILAIVLWNFKRDWYWPLISSLVLVSYMAFITFILFPAAPPWWATKYGYLLDQPVTLSRFAMPIAVEIGSPNPVAAMPSLHCAWPTLFVAIGVSAWGKKGWWLLLPCLLIMFSTVYLGHHYVIDIIAGVLYALAAYLIIMIIRWIRRRHRRDVSIVSLPD